jgi:ribosomal-protein-alanine N-acetyltransferase
LNIIINSAETGDISRICELEQAIFSDPWSKESLLFAARNNIFLTAKTESGEIAGYLVASGDEREVDLLILAVSEPFRRQGIAKKLLDKLTEQRQSAAIWLEVRESNHTARQFYEKDGFIKQFIRKAYYENPIEDAVCMLKNP